MTIYHHDDANPTVQVLLKVYHKVDGWAGYTSCDFNDKEYATYLRVMEYIEDEINRMKATP